MRHFLARLESESTEDYRCAGLEAPTDAADGFRPAFLPRGERRRYQGANRENSGQRPLCEGG